MFGTLVIDASIEGITVLNLQRRAELVGHAYCYDILIDNPIARPSNNMLALGIKGIEYTVLRMGYVFWAFYTPPYNVHFHRTFATLSSA